MSTPLVCPLCSTVFGYGLEHRCPRLVTTNVLAGVEGGEGA